MTDKTLNPVACLICYRDYCPDDDKEECIPYSLCCGHTLCKNCMTEMERKYASHCPLCRAYFGDKPVSRNYQLEETVKMIQMFLGTEKAAEQKLIEQEIKLNEQQEKMKSLEQTTAHLQVQLKNFKEKLKDVEFEIKMQDIIEKNIFNQKPDHDRIHNEARQWLESNDEILQEKKERAEELLKSVRIDYLRKFKDTYFYDPVAGYVKMDRNVQKRMFPFVGRMSYRQLLTYALLGKMDEEQTEQFNVFLGIFAKNIGAQNRFNSINK